MEWADEFTLKSADVKDKVPFLTRGARAVRKYRDGYFIICLTGGQQAHFFLEVDQGTMTNALWQEKVRAYTEFRDSGRSKRHYGTRNLRVLGVTTGERQMMNLKRATE